MARSVICSPSPASVTSPTPLVAVVVRNGKFVLPSDARHSGPVAYWLNRQSIDIYNRAADLMIAKGSLQTADGNMVIALKLVLKFINNEIHKVREHGHKLRKYVLNVEEVPGINEPRNWDRA